MHGTFNKLCPDIVKGNYSVGPEMLLSVHSIAIVPLQLQLLKSPSTVGTNMLKCLFGMLIAACTPYSHFRKYSFDQPLP